MVDIRMKILESFRDLCKKIKYKWNYPYSSDNFVVQEFLKEIKTLQDEKNEIELLKLSEMIRYYDESLLTFDEKNSLLEILAFRMWTPIKRMGY